MLLRLGGRHAPAAVLDIRKHLTGFEKCMPRLALYASENAEGLAVPTLREGALTILFKLGGIPLTPPDAWRQLPLERNPHVQLKLPVPGLLHSHSPPNH